MFEAYRALGGNGNSNTSHVKVHPDISPPIVIILLIQIHLMLKFIGETMEDRTDEIIFKYISC